MCGIGGIFGKGHNNDCSSKLKTHFLDRLRHRGPDGSGTRETQNYFLSHTRLSFQDLSKNSEQPMQDFEKRYTIAFNGEIYNFRELREQLQKKGVEFKTQSDTEVILEGFARSGRLFFNELSGMYAIAIVDEKENKLTLAVDQFGIKSLYYRVEKSKITFASELKAMEPNTSKTIQSKVLYLSLGYVPAPLTMFDSYFKMVPGEVIEVQLDNNIKKYQVKSESNIISSCSNSTISDLLSRSVKRHMISDTTIGCLFSGGLDSYTIALLAKRIDKKIPLISVQFEDKSINEANFQNEFAQTLDSEVITQCFSKEDVFHEYEKYLDAMDQPTIDGFNTFLATKVCKEVGVKGVLSGVGADEIFYGYKTYRTADKLKKLRPYMPQIWEYFPNEKIQRLQYLRLPDDFGIYFAIRSQLSIKKISEILNITVKQIFDILNGFVRERFKDRRMAFNQLEIELYMSGQLLTDADVFSMINSVEVRTPYLDRELVNYVSKLPDEKKLTKLNKELLINSFSSEIPSKLKYRSKMGFSNPYAFIIEHPRFSKVNSEYNDLNPYQKVLVGNLYA